MARISRSGRRYGILLGLAATFVATPGQAAAPKGMVEELRERYQRSYIDMQSVPVAGQVFGRGAVLVLGADGIPANPLRMTQLTAKSRQFHVGDFAPVEVSADGRLAARPASLTLAKGTRLVVLDLKVDSDRIRLFTHTLDPVGVASGQPVYGCTEFVFRFDPAVLDRGDLLEIERRIDEWVPLLERRG